MTKIQRKFADGEWTLILHDEGYGHQPYANLAAEAVARAAMSGASFWASTAIQHSMTQCRGFPWSVGRFADESLHDSQLIRLEAELGVRQPGREGLLTHLLADCLQELPAQLARIYNDPAPYEALGQAWETPADYARALFPDVDSMLYRPRLPQQIRDFLGDISEERFQKTRRRAFYFIGIDFLSDVETPTAKSSPLIAILEAMASQQAVPTP